MADQRAVLLSSKEESPGSKSFVFETKDPISYSAGQFLRLTLSGVINDPRGPSRFFSIASSPTEPHIFIATTISESLFKQTLTNLLVGQEVTITAPFGKFTLDEKAKSHVFLSGGIGITPFRSMLKAATDQKLPHKITLLYSNSTPEDVVFREDLEQISAQNPNITIVHTMTKPQDAKTPWTGKTGRVSVELIREYAKDLINTLFYICGPPSMVEGLYSLVKGLGVSEENIKTERFTGYQ